MNPQRLLKSFSAKDAAAQGNSLACVPSVMGVLDLYGDAIFPGAFNKALPNFRKRGFVPVSHEWLWESVVGYPTMIEERGSLLYSEFTFHSDRASQDALIKCRERIDAGLDVGLSVGFSMELSQYKEFDNGAALLSFAEKNRYDLRLFDVKGIRAHTGPCSAILEIEDLWEYSLTPTPANQQAIAIAVKSMADRGSTIFLSTRGATRAMPELNNVGANNKVMRLNSVCGARGLKLAPREKGWSASSAQTRVKAWAGAEDAPNEKYARAFALLSGPNDEFASYHLPFADVEDGELVAVPKAIMAAAEVLKGSRGGVEISETDRESAKRFVEAYYVKMAKAADDETIRVPWAKENSDDAAMFKGQFLGTYVEYSMCMSACYQASYALFDALGDILLGWGCYSDMTDDEIDDCLEGMFDEHKDLCMSVFRAIKGGSGAETSEEAVKSIKKMMLATMSAGGLGSGLPWSKHADAAVTAVRLMVERGVAKADIRAKEKRTLSGTDRATLASMHSELAKLTDTLKELVAKTEPAATERNAEIEVLQKQAAKVHAEAVRTLALIN